ncbi:hypothetical protein A2U01_0028313, partial [Trifolium medium]|nr:hypothetical protein [Trifolium medium]
VSQREQTDSDTRRRTQEHSRSTPGRTSASKESPPYRILLAVDGLGWQRIRQKVRQMPEARRHSHSTTK